MKALVFVAFIILSPSLVLSSSHRPSGDTNITVCLRSYLYLPDHEPLSVTIKNLYNNNSSVYHNVSKTEQCREYTVTDTVALKIWNVTLPGYNDHFVDALDLSGYGKHLIFTLYGNSVKAAKVWVNDTADKHDRYDPDIMDSLGYDQSYMVVNNVLHEAIHYSAVSSECYKCSPKPLGTIYPGALSFITVDSRFYTTHFFTLKERNCSFSHFFLEHSRVDVTLTNHSSNESLCKINYRVTIVGQNPYLPILFVAIVLIGSFIIWLVGTRLLSWARSRGLLHLRQCDRTFNKDIGNPDAIPSKKYGAVNSESEQLLLNPDKEEASTRKERLKSLDTVRGLSLVIMIFVNYGGGGYWFFSHSAWNGITVADLVFPWFVWIMGVSLVFSFRGRKKDSWYWRLYQILRRTAILLGLGLFLNNGFTLTHWRIPGVLQYFAVSYFVVAMTEFLSSYVYDHFRITKNLSVISDITNNWIQWVVVIVLELVWVGFTFFLKPGDCERGYLGPGGISEYSRYANCTTGGAAGYIDLKILGINHIYQSPTCKAVYDTGPYDPEGILGSLNAIVMCFLGVQAGRILVYHKQHGPRVLRFIIWGLALGIIAIGLCEAKRDGGLIPLNKNLWSLSFILLMAGMGYLLLTVFYILIDVAHAWNGAPFIYPGMNSIMVYVGSELLEGMFPFGWDNMRQDHFQYLASNVISTALWVLVAYYWFAIGFFVKI